MKYRTLHYLLIVILILIMTSACSDNAPATEAIPVADSAAQVTVPADTTPAATTAPPTTAAATATPAATATVAVTVTSAPVAVAGDARTEILAAFQKSYALPHRTDSAIRSSNGDVTLTGEFVPPNSVRTVTQMADFSMEMIIIGAEGWQAINGEWNSLPAETVQMVIEQASPEANLALLTAMINPQALGQQELDGRLVNVYQFESAVAGVTSTATVYVDAKTGLPVQQEIIGEADGIASTTTQKITYDDSIQITAP